MASTRRSAKIIVLVLLWTLRATFLNSALCHGQASVSNSDSGTTTDLKMNPLAALRAFEPPAGEQYQIGRGDEITLDFGGRTELNGKRIVGPDGRITLPLAGSVMVADKTRDEAGAAILAALQPFYSNLSVTVGVDKYTSNRVLLLGAVEHPGILTFDTPPTLLEVVTRGGVLGGVASGVDAQHKMPSIPERCAIYRGSDKVMWVDLKGLLDSGSPLADIRLRRDDVIYVPSTQDRYISVLGQVQHPGAFQLESTTTLRKLLAEAGGLTDAAGANPSIRVISPSTGATRTIPLKTLMQPVPLDLTLKSGDVVFVPKSTFNNVSYVFEKISPLISLFTAFAFLNQ
jgi:polysaccharide export outer membrane protein